MNYFTDSKIIKLVPYLFLFFVSLKILFTYQDIKKNEYDFVNEEAKVLANYVVSNRTYYQNLFLNGNLEINANTLKALPAFSSHFISKHFSKNNTRNITLTTVSDRARNPLNQANNEETDIIKLFKNNKLKKEYFSDNNSEYYRYAKVLRIEEQCLKCHSKKENAPLFIQKNYDRAYNYKLGDVRGILSVKIPKDNLNEYFYASFFYTIIYDILFIIIIFLLAQYLLKKINIINRSLTLKVLQKSKELRKSLFTNTLTSLPNRLQLMKDIENASVDSNLALALINIDSFKNVNDLYGFSVGDQLLNEVSVFIENLCTENKHLYKLPNDEYALLNLNQKDEEIFTTQVQNLIKKMEQTSFKFGDSNIFITFSCGIAFGKTSLLIKADTALTMSQNKNLSFVIYDNSLNKKDMQIKNLKSISLIKDAVKHDLIVPYFQPIYNNETKQIEKYECLARINTLDNKVLLPYEFLEVSIKGKLYHHITRAIVRKSFKFFEDKDFEFSINISINDINNQKTYEYIVDSLRNYAHPEKVVFEILETDKIENYEKLKGFIKITKSFGCKIAIDDFGSGYSNFAHILTLNVDYLKIDASLVKNVLNDEHSRIITQTIINFANNLNLKTIAEYVEDIESLELLEKMGSHYIQGYYIGEPKESLV
jgi:diguanylate cyclase (GGDEF)-like protein